MAEQIAQHVVGVPARPLRPFVSRYIGYRYEGFEPGVHAGLPSRHLTFVVSLGDPLEVGAMRNPDAPPQRLTALVGGLHAEPATIHHDGSQYGVQLEITPLGARALFGMPSAEIAALAVPLASVLGGVACELLDRLHAAVIWSRRFAVLDQVLMRAITRLNEPSPEITFAWQQLISSGGAVGVGSLATEVGWSRRHLSERFRREFGLPPKIMARVIRFERARRMLIQPDRPALGMVAAITGYADQAHMTREWHEFAGASPTAWMAAEQLPFVQDDLGDDAPDSSA